MSTTFIRRRQAHRIHVGVCSDVDMYQAHGRRRQQEAAGQSRPHPTATGGNMETKDDDLREEAAMRIAAEDGIDRVLDLLTARNIVNQIADYYMRRIPSEKWVDVRQATNDKLDGWVQYLLASKVLDLDLFGIDECRGDGDCPAPKHVHGCYRQHKASECLDESDAPDDWHLPENEQAQEVADA